MVLKRKKSSIITVGLCPVWDITCFVDGIEWGEHKKTAWQTSVPAGKALNISKALAWMGMESTAAGLWGKSDYQQLIEDLADINNFVDTRFTVAAGKTRQNITVVDTKENRDIHLRAESKLATKYSLRKLENDLEKLVNNNSTVIFAGSMPAGELLEDCLSLIKKAGGKGAKIVVDTSGIALKKIIQPGKVYIVKPNFNELCQLIGKTIADNSSSIIRAARTLCDKAEIIVVSRGAKGALAVTKEDAFQCKVKETARKAVNTVACGDYLLAGFVSQFKNGNIRKALETGVKVATAKAWGLTAKMNWTQAEKEIELECNSLKV